MAWFIEFHWGWLLGAAGIGLAMGWVGVVHRGRGLSRRGVAWATAIFVAMIAIALARVLPGRPGYWLDLAVMMLAVYLLGCGAGAWLRGLLISRHAGS
jgi:hypothetical protein